MRGKQAAPLEVAVAVDIPLEIVEDTYGVRL